MKHQASDAGQVASGRLGPCSGHDCAHGSCHHRNGGETCYSGDIRRGHDGETRDQNGRCQTTEGRAYREPGEDSPGKGGDTVPGQREEQHTDTERSLEREGSAAGCRQTPS